MAVTERVRDTIAPAIAELAVELVDIEQVGPTLRVTIDRAGGIDLDLISRATRRISHLLDDADPLTHAYTLEVTSPGLERPLRLPAHFARAIGSQVSVKTQPGVAGTRRVAGVLLSADEHAIEVDTTDEGVRRLRYDEIERARTVFEWGPSPKPGTSKPTKKKKKKAASQ